MSHIRNKQKFLSFDAVVQNYDEDSNSKNSNNNSDLSNQLYHHNNKNNHYHKEEKIHKKSKGRQIYDKFIGDNIHKDDTLVNSTLSKIENLINLNNKNVLKLLFFFILVLFIERFFISIIVKLTKYFLLGYVWL